MTQSSDSTFPEQDAAARDSTQMPGQTPDIGSSLNESANEKTTNDKAAPEAANETAADELTADEAAEPVAQRAQETMPVVGLGGSAGGIQALSNFFDNMPEESGIVFVVILHLSPHHESNLSQVLQNHTAMPVVQVMERTKVEPNHVYVIAPNRQLVMSDGHLDLSEPELPRGKRVPIDLFFRTLAEAHGQHSMCIVLSGANSDGSIGLKRIKEWGGLTIAQDPNEAEHEEMPRAAIATGLVDWVLPVAQMPQRLLDYLSFEKALQLPPVDAPDVPLDTAPDVESPSMLQDEAVLQEVLGFLRMRTGHDFSSYKRGTVLRRIARRLQVNSLLDLPSYLAFLRTHPGETQSLLQDLLISVTNFFRDRDAFFALEAALPQLFRGKTSSGPVRVWVCGCATGEEAYSVAMLLIEYSMSLPSPPSIQVFATDLDGDALRELHFELLEQYARPSLVVNEELDIVHLSQHAGRFLQISGGQPTLNVLNVVAPSLCAPLRAALFRAGQTQIAVDVPRVPIEIEGAHRLVDIAVRPVQNPASARGFLLVIFDEKEATALVEPLVLGAAEPVVRQLEEEIRQLKIDLHATVEQFEISTEDLKASNEELQAANEELHAAGEELETGKEELQSINEELTTLNQEAKKRVEDLSRANSDLQNLMAATGIATLFLDRELRIMRYTPPAVELFSLIPTDQGRPLSDLAHRIDYQSLQEDADRVLDSLIPAERELRTVDGFWYLARLRPYRTVEDHISGVVLSFVDITERKRKEDEIYQMALRLEQQAQLFDTTLTSISDFAYTFDREGRFRYSNKPLLDLLGITLEEIVGKNFFDLRYPPQLAARLQRQIEEVFQNRSVVRDEMWFVSPSGVNGFYEYILTPVFGEDGRTVEVVAGSTRDMTQRRQAEEALRQSEERFRLLIDGMKDYALFLMDAGRCIIYWNKGAERIFGWTREEAMGQSGDMIFVPEDRAAGAPEQEAQTAMAQGSAADVRWHLRRDGTRFWTDGVNTSLHDEAGVFRGFAKLARDATREQEADEALQSAHDELEERVVERTRELTRINQELRGSEERFSQAFMASPLPILITTLQEGRVLDLNPSALRSLGRARDDVIGKLVTEAGNWKFPSGSREQIAQRLQQEGILSNVEATYRTAAGEVRDAMTFMNIIELNGEKCILTMVQDVTERKRAEQERKQLMERIVMAQEEERLRISRELHDQMGQQLTVLMMGMKALPEHPDAGWSKPSYETQVEDLQKLTVELMQQMHRLAWDLRPASLDNLGLEAALRQYVEQWSEQSGVQAEVVSTGLSAGTRPSPEVETALYRVVQEALTNAQRHAQATHVSVLVERRKDNIIAVIEDDGCGYQTEEKKEGPDGQQRPARLGLLGMGERMELVGGTLTIESSPGQGTTVFARASMKGREAP